mmetsp:Transcript_74468/g.194240  ORF Transcript_74468/g.194240 Transcript_74468/m.194240 type:complete len:264 (-) Transcript_74468:882-1673(-)
MRVEEPEAKRRRFSERTGQAARAPLGASPRADRRGEHALRKSGRKILAVELHLDEVHGQRVLVEREHPVLIRVGQRPHLVQYVRGQLALDQLRLCPLPRHLPRRVGAELHKVRLVLLGIRGYQPLRLVDAGFRLAVHLHYGKRRSLRTDLVQHSIRNLRHLLRNQLEEFRDLVAKHQVQRVDLPFVHLGEFGEVYRGKLLLHHSRIWKVSQRQPPLLGNLLVVLRQIRYQLLLLLGLPKHSRHLPFQVVYDVSVHFGQPCSLD